MQSIQFCRRGAGFCCALWLCIAVPASAQLQMPYGDYRL